jgi:hypothetical protein
VEYNGKYGYIDHNEKKLTAFEFNEAHSFSEGLAKVFKGETIYVNQGFIDKKGNLVIPYQYDHDYSTYSTWNEVRDFRDGLMLVARDGKLGYINNRGKEVIPTKYSSITPFHKGYAAYYMSDYGQWGIIYKSGKELTTPLYDQVDFDLVDAGYNLVITARKKDAADRYSDKIYGLFDIAGERNIILPYYDAIGKLSEGMISVKVNRKYGFVDSNGRQVIAPKYDFVDVFSKGTAIVQLGKKFGIINKSGKEIVPVKYDDIENFSEGLAAVVLNGKAGYVNESGQEVIPMQYADAFAFTNGVGAVKNGKYGFIDKTGKAITEAKYDKLTYFQNGISVVTVADKSGVVNKAGKEIVPLAYSTISLVDGYLYFEKDGKWGVMNSSGTIIIPAQFQGFIQQFIGDTAVAVRAEKAVYVDKNGKVVGELNQ